MPKKDKPAKEAEINQSAEQATEGRSIETVQDKVLKEAPNKKRSKQNK